MNNLDRKADLAYRYTIRDWRADLALPLIDELLAADHEKAHWLEGLMYSKGGLGVKVDEARALECLRRHAHRMPSVRSFLAMTRVLLEAGGEAKRVEALEWIQAAAKNWRSPDIDVAYGMYHQYAEPPSIRLARRHYWKAILGGRLTGLCGLVRVRVEQGQWWQPRLLALLGWIVMPVFVLCFGKKTRHWI
jgi:hypothetical protein